MGVPPNPGREWLSFVMERQGSEVAPRRIMTEQFDAAGLEHQLEQQQSKEKQHNARGRSSAPEPRKDLDRREEDREKTSFQKENVPLEAEKLTANRGQGEIDQPEQEQAGRRRKAQQDENGDGCASAALRPEEIVASVEPTKRGSCMEASEAGLYARRIHRASRDFEGRFGGQDAIAADES